MKTNSQETDLYSWNNVQLNRMGEDGHKYTADCTILVPGADPREIPWDLLLEAFDAYPNDKVEIGWIAPIHVAHGVINVGDVFRCEAEVTRAQSEFPTLQKIHRNIEKLDQTLDELMEDLQKRASQVEVVHFSTLDVICDLIKVQIQCLLDLYGLEGCYGSD